MRGSGIQYHSFGVLFAEQQADQLSQLPNASLATQLTPARFPFGPTPHVKAVRAQAINEPIQAIPISVQPIGTSGDSESDW